MRQRRQVSRSVSLVPLLSMLSRASASPVPSSPGPLSCYAPPHGRVLISSIPKTGPARHSACVFCPVSAFRYGTSRIPRCVSLASCGVRRSVNVQQYHYRAHDDGDARGREDGPAQPLQTVMSMGLLLLFVLLMFSNVSQPPETVFRLTRSHEYSVERITPDSQIKYYVKVCLCTVSPRGSAFFHRGLQDDSDSVPLSRMLTSLVCTRAPRSRHSRKTTEETQSRRDASA